MNKLFAGILLLIVITIIITLSLLIGLNFYNLNVDIYNWKYYVGSFFIMFSYFLFRTVDTILTISVKEEK